MTGVPAVPCRAAGPAHHRPGPGARRTSARGDERRGGHGPVRGAGRQPARRQRAGRGRAGDDAAGADARRAGGRRDRRLRCRPGADSGRGAASALEVRRRWRGAASHVREASARGAGVSGRRGRLRRAPGPGQPVHVPARGRGRLRGPCPAERRRAARRSPAEPFPAARWPICPSTAARSASCWGRTPTDLLPRAWRCSCPMPTP